MDIWSALLPLLCLLSGGGVIAALLVYRGRRHKPDRKELPTDLLADLFIDREE